MSIKVTNSDNAAFRRWAKLGRSASLLKKARMQRNADTLASMRQDSTYASSSNINLARDLEHVYSEVLRNEYPDNMALSLFPMDRSVPPGARTHTIKRISAQGRPQVHRGSGQSVPAVTLSADEETFKVLYYVLGVQWDHFEELSSDYANSNLLQESLTASRDIMLEFWNEKTWKGDAENDLPGVLNYPYINKKVMGSTIFETGGNAENMLSEMQKLIDVPGELNKGKAILRPNTVVVSVRHKQILENTYFSGVEGPTVLSRLESSKGVKVISAWEMQGSGPGGTDQVLVFKAGDRNSIANVPVMPFTQLPIQREGFDYTIPCFMAHGGVIMRKPLMNVIGYADVRS